MYGRLAILGLVAVGGLLAYLGGELLARSLRSSLQSFPVPNIVLLVEGADCESAVPETDQFMRELRLTNRATEPVRLSGFENSCSCLSVQPSGASLAPGETKPFSVALSGLIPERATIPPDGVFRQSVTLTPVFSVGDSEKRHRQTVEIRYALRAGVRLSPAAVQLGVLSNRAKVEPRSVTCQLMDGVAGVAVEPHAEWSASVEAGGERTRVVRLFPKNPTAIREIADTIRIVPLDGRGTNLPAKSLRLVGEVRADIQAEPVTVPFGRVTVGATSEDVFRLVSLTRRPFTILGGTSASADLSVAPQPADAKSFLVRLTAKQLGEQEIPVTVRVKQDDGREVIVSVPVRYRGEPRPEGGQ